MLEKINNKIIPFLDKIFVGRGKKYSLFFTAMIDSVIAILPTDLIMVYYFLRERTASPGLQAIFIALGSIVGGSILFFLSSGFVGFFPFLGDSEYYKKIEEILNYSLVIQFLFIIFFAFSSLVPFTGLSILLGLFKIPYIWVYIPAMFLGRFLRFFLIAFLTKKYGKTSIDFLKKNIYGTILIFILILGIYLLFKKI